MPIQFDCPACKKALRAPDNMAGKYINCPLCQSFVPVPTSQGVEINLVEENSGPPPIDGIPQWYYVKNQQQVGPIPLNQLGQLAATGQLGPKDMVWRKGMTEWTIARNVKELGQVEWTSPPPIPGSAPLIMAEPVEEGALYDVELLGEAKVIAASELSKSTNGRTEWLEEVPARRRRQDDPFEEGLPSSKPRRSVADNTSSGMAFLNPLREKYPVFRQWTDKAILLAGAGVLFSFFLCCGGLVAISDKQERERAEARRKAEKEAKLELAKANELWTEGKKAGAVTKYKAIIEKDITFIGSGDRPTVYQRVIEHEVEQGNTSAAKGFINDALGRDLALSLSGEKARELLVLVQRERQERQAAAEKKRQEELALAKNKEKEEKKAVANAKDQMSSSNEDKVNKGSKEYKDGFELGASHGRFDRNRRVIDPTYRGEYKDDRNPYSEATDKQRHFNWWYGYHDGHDSTFVP